MTYAFPRILCCLDGSNQHSKPKAHQWQQQHQRLGMRMHPTHEMDMHGAPCANLRYIAISTASLILICQRGGLPETVKVSSLDNEDSAVRVLWQATRISPFQHLPLAAEQAIFAGAQLVSIVGHSPLHHMHVASLCRSQHDHAGNWPCVCYSALPVISFRLMLPQPLDDVEVTCRNSRALSNNLAYAPPTYQACNGCA